MASATLRASYFGASSTEPAGVSAEGGIKFNREDSQSGTTPVPIPTSAGTAYSWYKEIALEVTTTGTTTVSNRTVARSSAPPAGLVLYFASSSGYVQPTSGNRPTDSSTGDDAAPAGYTALTTSTVAYSTESVTTAAGRNGGFAKLLLGVSSTGTYTGGAGSAVTLPNVLVGYDEA